MQALGIFEGGGVKGLAHVGALAAAEARNIRFVGVAGTSAGAIVAALVAVGYEAKELYDPNGGLARGLFDIDYLEFFDKQTWKKLRLLAFDAKRKFSGNVSQTGLLNIIRTWLRLPGFCLNHRYILLSLARERGIFCTEKFGQWLEKKLIEKLVITHPHTKDELSHSQARVLFRHIQTPLRIIATDLTNQTIRVYSNKKPQDQDRSVVEAVLASMSIPLVFKPQRRTEAGKEIELVDGGLLSNFPAWVFDEERISLPQRTQTFGFRFLVQKNAEDVSNFGLVNFVSNLVLTALSGSDHLQSRQIEDLHIIPLRVDTRTLELDLEKNDRSALYDRGNLCARTFFDDYVGPADAKEMQIRLQFIHSRMSQVIKRPGIHLRVSVLVPVGLYKDHLKIVYRYNFDEKDADDQMEMKLDAGASGRCWQDKDCVICDLKEAASGFNTTWKLTKYQQALVRPTLKICLCLPIYTKNGEQSQNPMLGVLSIDSDEDLLEVFGQNQGKNEVIQAARDCSKLTSEWLIR